ncbi:protein of unknown function (DUF4034) [Abditibacterium utsteinense]|uniref:Uncharacterized protein n=1 Tax=Abditibacterium utsteinense TaxID=1960156 RepID=A0A2S8SSZ5_9BACT|nr:DUF4034 domain-containing protein [Abditibacterium utsteinense]PQV63923.1 protein of unknown function (DUF4034) [Abditibacterium utsteinense]
MDPASAPNGEKWLKTARSVRHNFPDLQLQPLQYEPGDAAREQTLWQQKGAALLAAKRYDEIEKTAALQKSGAANAKGSPHLSFLFEGLAGENADFAVRQKQIAAWRVARPQSNSARLAEIEMRTNAAFQARLDDYASTITPAMRAKLNAALAQSSHGLKNLPKTAFESPLAFVVALDCGLLAGAPREFLDDLFTAGTNKFPDYLPLYRTRAIHLLPRWLGEPGEALAMIETRADQIGGENGDIFYARVIWHLAQSTGQLSRDFDFNYERVRRGLEFLHRRRPDSRSVASARLDLAFRARDWKTSQQMLSAPNGHILDNSWERWAIPHNQNNFPSNECLFWEKRCAKPPNQHHPFHFLWTQHPNRRKLFCRVFVSGFSPLCPIPFSIRCKLFQHLTAKPRSSIPYLRSKSTALTCRDCRFRFASF